ncbi:MAG: nucleotide exchange factor GrpE [Clostridia bacterium]|nr:nucleotide exchange factor GrpE [Clostridia bacterium]
MTKIIGIDLGATSSRVAVWENGRPTVLRDEKGNAGLPSIVACKDGRLLTGSAAVARMRERPESVITELRKELGTDVRYRSGGKEYRPELIAAAVIQQLRLRAEAHLGTPVTEAVLTVPAMCDAAGRRAIADAANIAGLEVKRIICVPVAGILAYGAGRSGKERILAIDLGGGSAGIAVADRDNGRFEVLSQSGNDTLGGADFDRCIANYLAESFLRSTYIDLRNDRRAMRRLTEAAERAKQTLTREAEAMVEVPYIALDDFGPRHLKAALGREQFRRLTAEPMERILRYTEQVLRDAGTDGAGIGTVLLAGGASRIPALTELAVRINGKRPLAFSEPETAAVCGAATLGAVLSGELGETELTGITPYALGVETAGGMFTPLIERNAAIPVTRKRVFTTMRDGQTEFELHILQGNAADAAGNKDLGRSTLQGIAPAPAGAGKIEVGFSLDENGFVSVTATDPATGETRQVAVKGAAGLSAEEIHRAKAELAAYEPKAAAPKETPKAPETFVRPAAAPKPGRDEETIRYCVTELLPVLDNFERAVNTACTDEGWKKGMELIGRQLTETLARLGMEEIPAEGMFDPRFHHAVMTEAAEGRASGEILEVIQKGYRVGGKIIRYAMVKVAE